MKRRILNLLVAVAALAFVVSCNSNQSENGNEISSGVVDNPETANGKLDKDKLPQIKFDTIVHNFGDIVEGEVVSYSFKFTNTGKSDLVISDASASCGCTIAHKPEDPVPPGEQAAIDVSFDSHNRPGRVDKKITIIANTIPNTTVIKITGKVISPVK